MVRSAHSRPVAISTGRTSTGGSTAGGCVSRPTARCAAAIPRWTISFTGAAIRPLASWSGRALSIFLVALGAHHHSAAANHRTVDSLDHARSIGLGYFNQRMAFAEVDLSDVIARNAALSGNDAHQVADFDAIAGADGHE
jgi:hypothetical protein